MTMCNRCLGLQGTWLAWKFPKKVKLVISLVERDTEDAHGVDGDDVGGLTWGTCRHANYHMPIVWGARQDRE